MSFRHVIAVAAALLCTSAFAQSEVPTASSSADTAATASVAAPAGAASVAKSTPSPATDSEPAAAASAPAATVAQTKPAAGLGLLPGDPAAGKAKSAVCAACHGMDGNSASAQYPKLAGQSERYIARQLKLFKSGERASAIMAGFASPLSLEDMHDLGAYYAQQTPTYGVADAELVDLGRSLYLGGDAERDIPACMACHGPAGAGNLGPPYPHLAGQHAKYVRQVLHAWKEGDKWGDDALAKVMPMIAERLTDKDILALSSYIQGLHHDTSAGGK